MPKRFADTTSTESVSVSIANIFVLLIFEIHFFKSFSLRTVSYLASRFFKDSFSMSLLIGANSSSAKIRSSSSSFGLS